MKFFEKYFCLLACAATVLGLLVPAVGKPFRFIPVWLMGILFFSALKLDFSAALREFRRPGFLVYLVAMCMVVLPVAVWAASRWMFEPELAKGVLILGLMPAGVACGSLTDIVRGNAALALVVVLATSVLCPAIVPLVLAVATGESVAGGTALLAHRAGYLAVILFVPMTAAWVVRRRWPATVARHRDAFTGASILFLNLVILGAMSSASDDFLRLLRQNPWQVVKLMGFLCGFSAVLHVAGYWLAPWRPIEDRAALSVNAAYVNNGLGVAFAKAFYSPLAMLPSVLLEIPMTLAIPVLQWYLARAKARVSPRITQRGRCPQPNDASRVTGRSP